MRELRGARISIIFQEPMTSLNPVFTVGRQLMEAIRAHQFMNKREALSESSRILETVGVVPGKQRIRDYPHQLSGGQRQRVMIAIALSCQPSLLIADEPTTALDVTIQAQILDLIQKLKEQHRTSVIIITHDVDEAVLLSDRVIMMTNGPEATIGEILEVNLERPRNRVELQHDPEYIRCREAILSFLYEKFAKEDE